MKIAVIGTNHVGIEMAVTSISWILLHKLGFAYEQIG